MAETPRNPMFHTGARVRVTDKRDVHYGSEGEIVKDFISMRDGDVVAQVKIDNGAVMLYLVEQLDVVTTPGSGAASAGQP